jgi:hypothetical protein
MASGEFGPVAEWISTILRFDLRVLLPFRPLASVGIRTVAQRRRAA